MSRLIWDETGKRRYENGVSNAVLYTPGSIESDWVVYSDAYVPSVSSSVFRIEFDENQSGVPFDADLVQDGTFYVLSDTITESDSEPDYPEKIWCTKTQSGYSYREHVAYIRKNSSSEEKEAFELYIEGTFSVSVSMSPSLNVRTSERIIKLTAALSGSTPMTSEIISSLEGMCNNAQFIFVYEVSHEYDKFNFTDGTMRAVPDGQPYYFGHVWNGITSISENPDGAEANDMWADNMKYSSPRSKETYGVTVEAYTYPDEFAVCDGTEIPVNGVKLGQQKRLPFALAYKTNIGSDGSTGVDEGYLLHLVYNCTASPTDRAYETINDSPDAITFSWEVDSNPVKFDETDFSGFAPVSSIVIDSTKISDDAPVKTIGSKTYRPTVAGFNLLESILFGTDETAPVMPSPDYVLKCFEVT